MSSLVKKETSPQLDLFSTIQQLKKFSTPFIQQLEHMALAKVIEEWLSHLHGETKRNYAYYISDLILRGFIPNNTVGYFNKMPHEANIDNIKTVKEWSEGTRQLKAACYISLTSYLNRISQGWFRKAIPSNLASNKTFFQVRDKCATEALTLHEWHKFIEALEGINLRDSLIAKCMLQGAKRISEVLNLTEDRIDFENGIIRFAQSKMRGTLRWIPISFPIAFLNSLKQYLYLTNNERKEDKLVFITRNGKKTHRSRLNFAFSKASKIAGTINVTPHVLRATWVTLAKSQGVPDSEVMKVTGHSSSKMVYAYDKSSAENNYTKKLVLI